MRNKIAAVLLAATMACAVFTGCSGGSPAPSSPSSSKPSGSASASSSNSTENSGSSSSSNSNSSASSSTSSSNSTDAVPINVISVLPTDPDSSPTIKNTNLLKLHFDSGNYYIAKDTVLGNTIFCSFTVTNPNQTNGIALARVLVTVKDSTGATIKMMGLNIPAIAPNDTITFGDSITLGDKTPASISFSVDYMTDLSATDANLFVKQSDLKVSDTTRTTHSRSTHFTGKVTNISSSNQGLTHIYVFYRKDNQLLYGGFSYVSPFTAGQSASFDITTRTELAKSYPYVILAAPMKTGA